MTRNLTRSPMIMWYMATMKGPTNLKPLQKSYFAFVSVIFHFVQCPLFHFVVVWNSLAEPNTTNGKNSAKPVLLFKLCGSLKLIWWFEAEVDLRIKVVLQSVLNLTKTFIISPPSLLKDHHKTKNLNVVTSNASETTLKHPSYQSSASKLWMSF